MKFSDKAREKNAIRVPAASRTLNIRGLLALPDSFRGFTLIKSIAPYSDTPSLDYLGKIKMSELLPPQSFFITASSKTTPQSY